MQRSFEDLGTPLCDVTFVVLDLETTGGSPATCEITEVGAARYRGGECLGTLATLVNPGVPIPPSITYLTGITEVMVAPAPPIAEVLPTLVEFIGDAVIVGHNIRFDLRFINAALRRECYPGLGNRFVDTAALARRLVRDEVRDCKLVTLAERFRTATRPTHRAFDDAMATAEVLHHLLERAGSLGVLALDDLIDLPTVRGHPQLSKLRLVQRLPRAPGVYLFRDRGGRVLYVGKAVDLRRRVRSYFTGDERRKVSQLLRETESIDHVVCAGELEAAVLEVRLIHQLMPRFNRQSKLWRKYAYLKVTLNERFPRLSVVRSAKPDDGCLYIGPLTSTKAARLVAEAIESSVPIRRCTKTPGRVTRSAPCAPAQLGVSTCPCAGDISEAGYNALVDQVVAGLTGSPELLLGPLESKMRALSSAQRFEEAADVRDRADALVRALARQRRLDGLRRAGRIVVDVEGEGGALLDCGRLVAAWPNGDAVPLSFETESVADDRDGPLARDVADEVSTVAAWLEAKADRVRLVECDRGLASPLPRLPRFEPRRPRAAASRDDQ